jgi:hypothetical protein
MRGKPNDPLKHNEWGSPLVYFEFAKNVMGSIDLDPATSRELEVNLLQISPEACRYYENDNGLKTRWFGNVWMNPPYNIDPVIYGDKQPASVHWLITALDKYNSREICQAIILLNRSSSRIYREAVRSSVAYYQLPYRIKFEEAPSRVALREIVKPNSPMYESDLIYLGHNPDHFLLKAAEYFGEAPPATGHQQRPREHK